MGNLFKKAEEKGATGPAKKTDKKEVVVTDPLFHLSLSRLAEVNAEIDALSAESAVLGSEVKTRSIQEFQKLYLEDKKFPGSFIIKASVPEQKSASLMFIAADRYITIDKTRAEELQKAYGNEIVDKKVTYVMDTALIEKYGDVISTLIEKCKSIPDDDKEKLISAVTKFEVKKGTISDIVTKYSKKPMDEVLADIKPVYQMKNIRIDEPKTIFALTNPKQKNSF